MATAPGIRLGERLAHSAFRETAMLVRQKPAGRNANGEWTPAERSAQSVNVATAPLTGRQRMALPEGLRGKELRNFWLVERVVAVLDAKSLSADGDVIEYGGQRWRARVSENWGGFYSVTAEWQP